MKSALMLVFAFAVAGGSSRALAQFINTPAEVEARAVLHNDNTRTDVMKDPYKHEMSETTFDSRGTVISQKKYLLNANSDPVQGQIFDGAGNLVARVQFTFDDLQRLSEERCMNLQGEVFRKVLHQYDQSGRPLPLQAMDYKVHAPNMRTAAIDFTRNSHVPKPVPAQTGPIQPGETPQIQSVSTTTGDAYDMTPQQQAAYAQQQAGAAAAAQVQAQQQQAKDKKKGSNLNPLNWFKKKDGN